MKLKVHKIRNVDKSVCCAEQMIAYNMAFFFDHLKKRYQEIETEFQRSAARIEIRDHMMDYYGKHHGWKKLNPDAVFVALNAGLNGWLENPRTLIATNYQEVGAAFPILYDIE